MEPYLEQFEVNRENWNARTRVHTESRFYDVEGFRNGATSLNAIELQELGPVEGRSLLHLQCHFGQDTLSWAREGAHVTGVDFSDVAIDTARQLAAELGLEARFILSNIYHLPDHLDESFDRVFTSYGTIGWLPDLRPWGQIIARYLKPGGVFYMVDFHPVIWMFDDAVETVGYPYFNLGPLYFEESGTYADRDSDLNLRVYNWNHSLSDILNALLTAGLHLEFVHEFPYSPYNIFPGMEQDERGCWQIARYREKLPLLYSIRARRPA